MSLAVARGKTREPLRILLHGQEGVGKTTWAAGCPGAAFASAEDGGGDLDLARLSLDPSLRSLPSWGDLRKAVRSLIADAQGFRAIVIDTIDSYERRLWEALCERANVQSIEEVGGGYGKGFTAAAEEMAALSRDLDELRARQRVHVIVLAHSHVRPFNDPLGHPFDRYELRLHKGTSALWSSWADAVLFACFDVTVKMARRVDERDPLKKGKAVDAQRVVLTSKAAAYDAKNRQGLPEELPLDWAAFAKAIRWEERDAACRPFAAPAKSFDLKAVLKTIEAMPTLEACSAFRQEMNALGLRDKATKDEVRVALTARENALRAAGVPAVPDAIADAAAERRALLVRMIDAAVTEAMLPDEEECRRYSLLRERDAQVQRIREADDVPADFGAAPAVAP